MRRMNHKSIIQSVTSAKKNLMMIKMMMMSKIIKKILINAITQENRNVMCIVSLI